MKLPKCKVLASDSVLITFYKKFVLLLVSALVLSFMGQDIYFFGYLKVERVKKLEFCKETKISLVKILLFESSKLRPPLPRKSEFLCAGTR